jgi:heptosyltransferase-2
MINKILFITLSNLGDVILTLPVLDTLRELYPGAKITVMVGPRPEEIFQDNPYIDKLIVYDKYAPLREKIKLFFALKKERFDIVIDLRNTLYGALLPARFRTSPFLHVPSYIRHMRERNLFRLQQALNLPAILASKTRLKTLFISQEDENYVNRLLEKNNILPWHKVVIIAAAAGGANRRWEREKFSQVAAGLTKDYRVVLVGRGCDKPINQSIRDNCKSAIFDFSGLTNLRQLAYLIKRASLVIVCDTGVLQMASYMDVPILALFGAGDEKKYGPWGYKNSKIILRDIFCRPCRKAQCRFAIVECMQLIKVEEVLRQAKEMLENREPLDKIRSLHRRTLSKVEAQRREDRSKALYKRILIVRTDKIGDVVLSTPVIKVLRDEYPDAYIAMMVSPYAKDIVEGNPYLDDVIIYDKNGKHKSWRRSIKFVGSLKKKRFDLALILHPTNRAHLVTFFAGIPRRIGYDSKCGFLLTDRIKHAKQFGERHELEYNLDLVRYLGIEPREKNLFIPFKTESEKHIDQLLETAGINKSEKILAIHPGASCPSKIWPQERFAQVADRLIKKYGFKAFVLGGPKDLSLAQNLVEHMRTPAINLAGKTSISQLASILRRCELFISNDSGPMHIAVAAGTPVIAIFGRSQKGLSPKRWGPLGKRDKILHKPVGCLECLAHNCKKEFACLKAISAEDVLGAADAILKTAICISREHTFRRK